MITSKIFENSSHFSVVLDWKYTSQCTHILFRQQLIKEFGNALKEYLARRGFSKLLIESPISNWGNATIGNWWYQNVSATWKDQLCCTNYIAVQHIRCIRRLNKDPPLTSNMESFETIVDGYSRQLLLQNSSP